MRNKTRDLFKNRWVRIVCYGLLLGLLCQVYISPFAYTSYVVSLGTPAVNALLLFQPELPVLPLLSIMSAVACLLRGTVGAVGNTGFMSMFLPALFYYGIYSILVSILFRIFNHARKFHLMMGMIVCDCAANAVQLALMGHPEGKAVIYSVLISVIRGAFVWLLYCMYEWEHLYLRKKEHQSHYAQLNQIVTDIYAESFYLKKSMEDLNELTRKSHQLYEDLESRGQDGQQALEIAREAHEIRKDYQRVAEGFSALIHEHEEKSMKLSAVLQIIEDNTKRQMAQRGKLLTFQVRLNTEMQIQHYYDLFTILNNLLVNSMDACEAGGHIGLSAEKQDRMLVLTVTDDGCGIDPDMQEYIWGAGFSTKYDKETGQMSTGIGLCHVANVVQYLGGMVELKSQPGKGSEFQIMLPAEAL
ncbi:sensor histidine kinase [Faecalicatena sp. AGMB00832]|uniref:histidine kinase n=1 Tax=Faecalicatena faecalis TaxID=2726362 RepID=A0ABS6DAU4_9FIRM|nr:sensor histidine kinase [Faecalicatena faecalis]MBU3878556.1 sensor histidine kinase [Faecalicatena faecalis]